MDWHRIFGLTVTDFYTDTKYRVELEKDLSVKQQYLDVVIIEQAEGPAVAEPPDGLENLAPHNLLTYKSVRETLDDWAVEELVGHYVNYRKQISPSFDELLAAEEFRLYAVATRFPQKLAADIALEEITDGVYEVRWGVRRIRIIVLSQVAKIPRNALWQMFSAIDANVQYGAANYRWRRTDTSTILNELYVRYRVEGITMPYTLQDYYRDYTKKHLHELTIEERLEGLSVDERLRGMSIEELLQRLPKEEILKNLPQEEIEAYLKRQKRKSARKK